MASRVAVLIWDYIFRLLWVIRLLYPLIVGHVTYRLLWCNAIISTLPQNVAVLVFTIVWEPLEWVVAVLYALYAGLVVESYHWKNFVIWCNFGWLAFNLKRFQITLLVSVHMSRTARWDAKKTRFRVRVVVFCKRKETASVPRMGEPPNIIQRKSSKEWNSL